MLETSLPSREGAARAAAQPLPHVSTRPAPPGTAGRSTPPRARKPASPSERMARSEARLLTMAVSCTAIVCALLVLYLAAYAHITMLGINQAQIRTTLRQKRLENETLKAAMAALQSPDHVTAAATAMGMTRDPKRIDYIVPPKPAATVSSSNDLTTQTASQVATSGPTDNPISARND